LKGGNNSEIFLPVDRFGYPPKSIELIESIFWNQNTMKNVVFDRVTPKFYENLANREILK